MTEIFLSVSVFALAWITIAHVLEITRLKNKIDSLIQDMKSINTAKIDSKPRKKTQAPSLRLKAEGKT